MINGEFVVRLNSDRIGFDDFLAEPITKRQVTEKLKLGALEKAIMKKRKVRTLQHYRTALKGRCNRVLRRNISSLTDIPPEDIDMNTGIRVYISDDASMEILYKGVRNDLHKFLLMSLTRKLFTGLVGQVRKEIFLRCT